MGGGRATAPVDAASEATAPSGVADANGLEASGAVGGADAPPEHVAAAELPVPVSSAISGGHRLALVDDGWREHEGSDGNAEATLTLLASE